VAKSGDLTEIQRLVMAEVTRQMGPVQELLKKLHDWQLGFWSNGSKDRPKGFFQMRIESDDRRYQEMVDEVSKLTDHKASVDAFIVELRLAREFREKREAEEKERQEIAEQKRVDRRNFWVLKIGIPVVLGILSLIGVIIKQAAPVVEILWKDYLKAHPAVSEQIKNKAASDPALADGKQSAEIFHSQ
jgi:hypothetical protein